MQAKRSKTFEFFGNPIPLQRARFSGGHVYDAQKHSKLIVSLSMEKQLADEELFVGPLEVIFEFHFPTAKRISATRKLQLYNKPFTQVPDCDNCIKFYLDCANKVLYNDDAAVTTIYAKKVYGPTPKVLMILSEL
jgi:Holliday junction resolvase RusA-like endonuclease